MEKKRGRLRNVEGTRPRGRYQCEEAGRIQRRRVGSNERQLGGNGEETRSSEVKRHRVTRKKRPLEPSCVPEKGRREGRGGGKSIIFEEKTVQGSYNKAQRRVTETEKERNKQ
ncbi:hypothetical protein NDU88_007239 [Pleurodeles waltl]|uniref:Uncharacterized protein n=1 Tax=Pleurodeles waltl TaxID=8319 RepID=A0AAV7RSG1_PLEWA|nr:hypothetical protein NDU88_007239 [Pleurodeles waltl]